MSPLTIPEEWMPVFIAGIAATPPSIVAWLVRRKVHELQIQVDGRLTELLEATRARADAEGEIRGRNHQNGS